MSGFNLPPGVSPSDIPGNDADDVDALELCAMLVSAIDSDTDGKRFASELRDTAQHCARRSLREMSVSSTADVVHEIIERGGSLATMWRNILAIKMTALVQCDTCAKLALIDFPEPDTYRCGVCLEIDDRTEAES